MTSKFTPEDLLQYLYKETSPEETAAIEQALTEDWTLREKLEVLQSAQRRLEAFRCSPRTETVLKVLHYATDSQLLQHPN
ncbi:MAG TPA: hypothetical protein PKE63_01945 [Lacibacter sp.]|nr:hypothetical protein [Lacibacter sp.]HMO88149.1 hypothetical protein [Lacibacter sp.]HMP86006.1 hypothetical protein [Lacibacter sp.]